MNLLFQLSEVICLLPTVLNKSTMWVWTNLSITSNMEWSISNKNNQTAWCTIGRPTNFLQKHQRVTIKALRDTVKADHRNLHFLFAMLYFQMLSHTGLDWAAYPGNCLTCWASTNHRSLTHLASGNFIAKKLFKLQNKQCFLHSTLPRKSLNTNLPFLFNNQTTSPHFLWANSQPGAAENFDYCS